MAPDFVQDYVVAHEVALSLRVLARLEAEDGLVVLIDLDAATRRTIGADAVGGLQPPDSLLVEEIFRAQRSDRADVDNVAGQFVIDRHPRKDVDLFVAAAVDDLQLARAADFASEPHAPRTHHAAVGEERDLVADVIFIRLNVLRFLKSAIATSIFVAVILQSAFTSLVTDWAVEGVIKQ